MSKSKRQAQAAVRRIGRDDKPALPPSKSSPSPVDPSPLTGSREEQVARGWRGWLEKQPNPAALNPTDVSAKPESTGKISAHPADTANMATHSLTDQDDNKNVHPPRTGAQNSNTDTEKENGMQTAKQDTSITDTASKVDLRDTPATKVSSLKDAAKPFSDDGIGSLFGPAIEDDVKGVRSQIRELIQCEMQGELGQRFSRNLRIVIRREIAAAIDDQFDRV